MATPDELERLRVDLREGRLPSRAAYTAIHRFGDGGYTQAIAEVEGCLHSPDPDIRYIAVNVLTLHWECSHHQATCERLAVDDPNGDVRRIAIAGLGALQEGRRDPRVLRLALSVFRDSNESWDVRDAAYCTILYVMGRPHSEQPLVTRPLDHVKDVDWSVIAEAERLMNANGYTG